MMACSSNLQAERNCKRFADDTMTVCLLHLNQDQCGKTRTAPQVRKLECTGRCSLGEWSQPSDELKPKDWCAEAVSLLQESILPCSQILILHSLPSNTVTMTLLQRNRKWCQLAYSGPDRMGGAELD